MVLLIKHEIKQNQELQYMRSVVQTIKAKFLILDPSLNKQPYENDAYNYLCIGNSITYHMIDSYWWNENGMAASTLDKDYYHLVLTYLNQKHDKVKSTIASYGIWEMNGHDRNGTFVMLNPYLSDKLNLITIQLGENAIDIKTIEKDYESLIRYCKQKAPKAKILLIGDFWEYKNRDLLKKQASIKAGVKYVSLEGIKDNPDYYANVGTIVYDKDGGEHEIWHEGVGKHPSDKGMAEIAKRIISAIDADFK